MASPRRASKFVWSDIVKVLPEAVDEAGEPAANAGSELEELFLNLTAEASERDRVGFGVAGAKVDGGQGGGA